MATDAASSAKFWGGESLQSQRFRRWWWCNRIVLSQLNKLNRHNSAQLDYDFVTSKKPTIYLRGWSHPLGWKWQKWHTPRKKKRQTGGKWGIKKYHVKCIRFSWARDDGEEKQIAQFFVSLFSGNLFIYDYLLRGKPGNLGILDAAEGDQLAVKNGTFSLKSVQCGHLVALWDLAWSKLIGMLRFVVIWRRFDECLTEIWWISTNGFKWILGRTFLIVWQRFDGYLTENWWIFNE